MRILHAPSNTANQAWALAQGQRALGHDARVWVYTPNRYGFPADREVDHEHRVENVMRVFEEAIEAGFDVFHFHYARSLMPPLDGIPMLWDLPVLRALGKKVVFTFHGSDVRLRSRHLEVDPWSYFRFADVPCDEDRITKQLAIIRTFADSLTVAGLPLLSFVPDAAYVPKALYLADYPVVGPKRTTEPLVVHVPSSRATKGTDFVLKGVAALQEKGASFDFRMAESLPHTELIALYAEADIIVDNLLLGDAEVSSLEAMALGKPVVTRITDEVREAHPSMPAVSADPDTFVDMLEPLLRDAKLRARLGEEGRAYVEANHASQIIAARIMPLYEGSASPVRRAFPDWAAIGADRKIEAYEERIQSLEVGIVELRKRNDGTVAKLREKIAAYEERLSVRLSNRLKRR